MQAANIVTTELPHRLSLAGSRWQVRSAADQPMIEAIIAGLTAIERGESTELRVLKRSERKVVFIANAGAGVAPIVAKVSWLHTWKRLLERKRFAEREAGNLIVAASRGLPVPRVHAIGYVKGRFGIPRRAVLAIECLTGFRSAKELLSEADEAGRAVILDRTLPAFESLYRTACNHLDLNGGNIMLAPDAGQAPMLLDLQYTTFSDAPSAEMLMFQAGWFARGCVPVTGRAMIDAWLERLLDRVGLGIQPQLKARFDYYMSTPLSREERLKMR